MVEKNSQTGQDGGDRTVRLGRVEESDWEEWGGGQNSQIGQGRTVRLSRIEMAKLVRIEQSDWVEQSSETGQDGTISPAMIEESDWVEQSSQTGLGRNVRLENRIVRLVRVEYSDWAGQNSQTGWGRTVKQGITRTHKHYVIYTETAI